MTSSKPNPLPLGDVLRDLAVLRATDVEPSGGTTLPDAESADSTRGVDGSQQFVQHSYQFVKEARGALRIQQQCDLDKQEEKLSLLRSKLEELQDGVREENT